jgi:hypothetical protein
MSPTQIRSSSVVPTRKARLTRSTAATSGSGMVVLIPRLLQRPTRPAVRMSRATRLGEQRISSRRSAWWTRGHP